MAAPDLEMQGLDRLWGLAKGTFIFYDNKRGTFGTILRLYKRKHILERRCRHEKVHSTDLGIHDDVCSYGLYD